MGLVSELSANDVRSPLLYALAGQGATPVEDYSRGYPIAHWETCESFDNIVIG